MPELEVPEPKSASIELVGVSGEFFLANRETTVRYFSTYATPSASDSGHYELLRLLKPMRERVRPHELKSLDALLQRDLSDERIAEELIPYLQGRTAQVGFFPPVLAVLLPNGFVHSKPGVTYPSVHGTSGTLEYGKFWWFTPYRTKGGGASRCGTLNINPALTDVIVLDGQHRANAFRYAAGSFAPEPQYSPFYKKASPIEGYQSDLPVTIIWFDASKRPIQPNNVSRELFVAVNNSAKRVSQSRTALLDETTHPHLALNTFYRWLAEERGFDLGKPSLFTCALDYDEELQSTRVPKHALTTPIVLAQAIKYFLFASGAYDQLGSRLREPPNAKDDNVERFARVVGKELAAKNGPAGYVLDDALRGEFRDRYRKNLIPVIEDMLSRPSFLKCHYAALAATDAWSKAATDAPYEHTWNAIIRSGEGLYSAYRSSTLDSTRVSRRLIDELEKRIVAFRAKEAGVPEARATQWYESFSSVAFQRGYLMAVAYLNRHYYPEEGGVLAASKKMSEVMGAVPLAKWDVFFNELRQRVVGETTPKSWPSYQKMLLLFCSEDLPDVFDDIDERVEVAIVANSLDQWRRLYRGEHMGEEPSEKDYRKKAHEFGTEAEALVRKLTKKPLDGKAAAQRALARKAE